MGGELSGRDKPTSGRVVNFCSDGVGEWVSWEVVGMGFGLPWAMFPLWSKNNSNLSA